MLGHHRGYLRLQASRLNVQQLHQVADLLEEASHGLDDLILELSAEEGG
jgi:hypothetical protein